MQLQKKFQTVPDWADPHIEFGDDQELESWFKPVLTADSIAAVFLY